jgi:flagellar biosynthetic protein FliR
MPGIEPLLAHLAPVMLVLARVAGVFTAAPVLGGRMVPARFKALLAFMLSLAMYPALPLHGPHPPADPFAIAGLLVAEGLIGLTIGLVAAIPLMSLELAGYIMGHQMGLGIARSFNPELDIESEAVGQVLFVLATLGFLAMDGLDRLLYALALSFDHVPLGAVRASAAPIELITGLVASGLELALRVAAPVMAVILLTLIAMGAVMKTMPQINILSVGFAVKILLGLGAVLLSLGVVDAVVADQLDLAADLAVAWVMGAQ